jgi:mercuric ion transport protein
LGKGDSLKEKLSSLGTILTAFLAGACCIGPFILIPLGLTSLAGSLALTFRQYSWWLYGIAFVFLAMSYFSTRKTNKRSSKLLFQFSTIMVISFFIVTIVLEFGLL